MALPGNGDFGPADFGQGGFGGAGAPGGKPLAPPEPPPAPYIYGPADDPFSWESVTLTRADKTGTNVANWQWPLIKNWGLAELTVADSAQKLDAQKASGKSKAKTKQAGIEPWKATLVLTILVKHWGFAIPMIQDLNPNGPSQGDPFNISHPEARLAGVKAVQVVKSGQMKWQKGGQIGTITYELEEWTPPAKAAAGTGTKTPTTAGGDDGGGAVFNPNWMMDRLNNRSADNPQGYGGFEGTEKPKASYP